MKNPYLSCFKPLTIWTSTHEPVLVPCGKCPACLNKKRTALGLKLHLEELHSKFAYFITLTYDNDYLPLYHCVRSSKKVSLDVLPCSQRIIDDFNGDDCTCDILRCSPELLDSFSAYSKQIRFHESRIGKTLPYGHGKFALLYYRDAQLWIKRVRQFIYRNYGEKVRYYIIGDYGTKSLRPHWHCLLFFDSSALANDFEDTIHVGTSQSPCECAKFLCSSWKYGICDSKRTNGESYFYVSSYVNKSSNFPLILDLLSPQKAYHSQFFGEVLSKEELRSCLINNDFDGFRNHSISNSDGSLSDYALWRSYYQRFFPVFSGLSSQDIETTFQLFTSFPKLVKYYGTDNVLSLAKKLYFDFSKDCSSMMASPFRIYRFAYEMCTKSDLSILSALCSVIRSSRNFLRYADFLGFTPPAYFRLWQKWYSYVDLSTLRTHYEQCEMDPYYARLYYKAYADEFNPANRKFPYALSYLHDKSDSCFLAFSFDETVKAYKSIKHREQVEFIKNNINLI